MFVVESRYQEAEAEIRKIAKGLKVGRDGGREGRKGESRQFCRGRGVTDAVSDG